MTRRVLVSSDDAVPANGQHTHPCSDCPWRRDALPGWLGSSTVDQWLQEAHSDARIPCHTLTGAQCAGAAIYRANVCKWPRDPAVLLLPKDKAAVFGFHNEFRAHHETKGNT